MPSFRLNKTQESISTDSLKYSNWSVISYRQAENIVFGFVILLIALDAVLEDVEAGRFSRFFHVRQRPETDLIKKFMFVI